MSVLLRYRGCLSLSRLNLFLLCATRLSFPWSMPAYCREPSDLMASWSKVGGFRIWTQRVEPKKVSEQALPAVLLFVSQTLPKNHTGCHNHVLAKQSQAPQNPNPTADRQNPALSKRRNLPGDIPYFSWFAWSIMGLSKQGYKYIPQLVSIVTLLITSVAESHEPCL